jgi:hypothetical protein
MDKDVFNLIGQIIYVKKLTKSIQLKWLNKIIQTD